MSRISWLPLTVLCLAVAGCASGGKMPAFLRGSNATAARDSKTAVARAPAVTTAAGPTVLASATAAPQSNLSQAEYAWRSGPGAAGYKLPTEYERGWREGYNDYLAYGNSGDPQLTNRTRTSSSNEWLAGFRDGMTSAYSAIASEYPTLVSAAEPPISRPTMQAVAEQPATIVAEASPPLPPMPRLERPIDPQPTMAPAMAPRQQAPTSTPRQEQPYTRMADNPRQPGMPLPGGLRADEVNQSAIYATGQQTPVAAQPAIVRLPDTGEAAPYGTR